MKMKNKNNKIELFPTNEERNEKANIDVKIRQSLMQEADAYEQELNANPKLSAVEAPADMLDRIMGELKENNLWEEEEVSQEKNDVPENVYGFLSAEDQEALLLGKKMRQKRKLLSWVGTAAAVAVCVFMVSMSGEANRKYVTELFRTFTGSKIDTRLNTTKEGTTYLGKEKDASEEVKTNFGIKIPRLQYRPEGMEYKECVVNEEMGYGNIFYAYQNTIVTLNFSHVLDESSFKKISDGGYEKIKTVELMDQEIVIWKINGMDGTHSYYAQFEYESIYYSLWAKFTEAEFEHVLSEIKF